MKKEIFILENMASCNSFLSEQIQKGSGPEGFLGVGAFLSSLYQDKDSGVEVNVTPKFLTEELLSSIVQGHVSMFEFESLLIQKQSPLCEIPLWLIFGNHPAPFVLPKTAIPTYIKPHEDFSMQEFVESYFNHVMAKAREIRAQVVVLLLNTDFLKSYMQAFFNWYQPSSYSPYSSQMSIDSSQMSVESSQMSIKEDFSEDALLKETLAALSNVDFYGKIVLVPPKQESFSKFLNLAADLRRKYNFNGDTIFSL